MARNHDPAVSNINSFYIAKAHLRRELLELPALTNPFKPRRFAIDNFRRLRIRDVIQISTRVPSRPIATSQYLSRRLHIALVPRATHSNKLPLPRRCPPRLVQLWLTLRLTLRFRRRNSKRHACECNCPCHACFQPREHTPQDSPSRSALHDHLETLELAERRAIFTVLNQPNSCSSYPISSVQQAPDSDYLDAIGQSELKAFFHFPPPDNKTRIQPEEFDKPFIVWSNDNEGEADLDLDEIN